MDITKEARDRVATAMERMAEIIRNDLADGWAERFQEANNMYMRIVTEEVLKVCTATAVKGHAATAANIMDRIVDETITKRRNGLRAVTAKKTRKR